MCNINEQKRAFEILHSQVCNGGFQQWLMNGYGKLAGTTIEALRAIGNADALSVAEMVEKVITEIEINDGGEEFIYEPEFADFADRLDTQYYKVSDALLKDAQTHFEQEKMENVVKNLNQKNHNLNSSITGDKYTTRQTYRK